MGVHPDDPQKTVPRPKLLLISGVADEKSMQEKRRFIGAAAILQKPFTPEALIRRVHKLLWQEDATPEGDTTWVKLRNRLSSPVSLGKW